MSPFIFLLVAGILAILTPENDDIKGIKFRESEIKLTQFADDVTCFLLMRDSLLCLLDSLDTFASWSGLRVKKNKTKIIFPKLLADNRTNVQGMPAVDKTKILGIWIGLENTQANSYDWNFKSQLQKIRATCDSWARATSRF